MNRLGLIHPDAMTGRPNTGLRALSRRLNEYTTFLYGTACTTKISMTSALIGFPGILLHSPELGDPFLRLATELEHMPGLSGRAKVITTLTTVVCEGAAYEIYAQQRVAVARELLSQVEVEHLTAGRRPETFDNEDSFVFETARELCRNPGTLSSLLWGVISERLGPQGALTLVQRVGFYRYIATVLNGCNAQVPPEDERIENFT